MRTVWHNVFLGNGMNNRAYSTDLNYHTGLIHTLTKKCWGRLVEAGVNEFEYEDIYQINCVSYVKVSRAYDPERGVTFTAYLGRAIYNEFNKFAERVIAEKCELGLIPYADFATEDGEADLLEFATTEQMAEDIMAEKISRDIARENIAKLSKLGKLVIRELLAPSDELKKTFEGLKAHAELSKQQGEKFIRVPKSIDFRTIKLHYGFRPRDIAGLKNEFKKQLGVEIE